MPIRTSYLPRAGLSDFQSWMPALTKNRSPMDVDFLLKSDDGKQLIVIEFKRSPEIPLGQQITLAELANRGVDVMAVTEDERWISAPPKWRWAAMSYPSLHALIVHWECDQASVAAYLRTLGWGGPRP